MFGRKKQILCKIISLCLLFSSLCLIKNEAVFFAEQNFSSEYQKKFSKECQLKRTSDYHQDIKKPDFDYSIQLYAKSKKAASNNYKLLLFGFAGGTLSNIFVSFYILNVINSEHNNLSLINILSFIHNKDGKK